MSNLQPFDFAQGKSPITNYQLPFTRRDLAALVAIAALVLLFFWRIWTPRAEDRAAFPPGDFTDQFWMFRVYQARAFAQGRLPLWSENFNSGHPFLADVQSAVFYPVSLIWTLAVVALRGADFSLLDLELEAIFHFMLAGAFTYLFACRVLNHRVAALASALAFTFSGYLTAYPPQQLAILETATWLPLVLLLIHLAQYRGGAYYFGAGVVLGIAALAGHPQTFLFVLYAAAIYFFWESRNHAKNFSHYALRFAVIFFIAAGISAVQWLPTLEYQLLSTRAAIGWAEASRGFPTMDPLQMILPGYVSLQSPLYIGILPLWLALFAFFANISREKIFWGLLALGSLLLAFGAYVFAYAVAYLFAPGFALFRGQERLALVVSFSLAMLVGYGMRELVRADFPVRLLRRAWALLPAGMTIAVLMLFAFYIAGAQKTSPRLGYLAERAGLMTLLFGLTAVVVYLLPRPLPRFGGGVQGWRLCLALIVFDLFSVAAPIYNVEPKPRFPVTPIVQTIHAERDRAPFRVADEGKMPGHFGIAYRVEEIGGISPLRLARYNDLLDNLPEEKLWQLLGVRYVVTGRPGFKDAEMIQNEGQTYLLRLNDSMPRAWLVGAVQVMDDRDALAVMAQASFEPGAAALIAEPLPFPRAPNAAFTPVQVEMRSPEHWRFSFSAPTDQLLVVSQNDYPGWRARVDGIETPIVRANVTLMAVPVRAGARVVELEYDPWTVKVGIAISAITTILVVFGMVLSPKKRGA